jgi:hypothetical protein
VASCSSGRIDDTPIRPSFRRSKHAGIGVAGPRYRAADSRSATAGRGQHPAAHPTRQALNPATPPRSSV